jgi:hypothetical protein
MVKLQYLTDVCTGDCTMTATFDLGPGRVRRDLTIAIDGAWAHVAWNGGAGLRLKRFHLDHGDAGVTVDPRPTQTVVAAPEAQFPHLAAYGRDIALAYGYRGDTRVRISDDRGRTFSGPRIIYEAPCTDCEAGSIPLSIDLFSPFILVEVLAGSPGSGGSIGFLSDDGFATWSETSQRDGARRVGALTHVGATRLIVEAWDNNLRTFPGDPGPANQRIRFRAGSMP